MSLKGGLVTASQVAMMKPRILHLGAKFVSHCNVFHAVSSLMRCISVSSLIRLLCQ